MADLIEQHILDKLAENGRMRTKDIVATMPDEARKIKTRLSDMTKDGRIESPKRGTYLIPSTATATDPQKWLSAAIKKLHSVERLAEDNERITNALLNTYEVLFALFRIWLIEDMVSEEVDFQKQLLFIENFKWLTMIGDKLMKRWNLVHHGYDTNSRQAQEDAKAKTEERQKEALKDAPLEDTIMVVGKFDPEAMELIDCVPSSLEKMTGKEKEKNSV